MNNDLVDIENALRRLTPRAPSEFCVARIAATLDAPARILPFRRMFAWSAALAAAAAVAAVALILSHGTTGEHGQAQTGTVAGTIAATGGFSSDAAPLAAITGTTAPATFAATPTANTLAAAADSATIVAENGQTSGIAPTERRILRSVEPLEIRRAPDGNFFQPYRVRYLNTVRASAPRRAGASPATFVESVPTEEVHFVRLNFM